MTWRPTDGIKRAESVIQTMLTDAATMGVHITNPTLRHRWVQVIGDALDGFRESSGFDQPEFPLEERDDGHDYSLEAVIGRVQAMAQPRDDVMGAPTNGEARRDLPDKLPFGDRAAKKRRGRPKGSKAKKAKAVKAPEAEAATS